MQGKWVFSMLKFQKGDYRECVNKTYRMPVEIVKQLEELSQKNHTSPTKILIQCVEYALAHVEEDSPEEA